METDRQADSRTVRHPWHSSMHEADTAGAMQRDTAQTHHRLMRGKKKNKKQNPQEHRAAGDGSSGGRGLVC